MLKSVPVTSYYSGLPPSKPLRPDSFVIRDGVSPPYTERGKTDWIPIFIGMVLF